MKLTLNPTQERRLRKRPHRRLVRVGNQLWWVSVDGDGVLFRAYQHKLGTMRLSWRDALEFIERRQPA